MIRATLAVVTAATLLAACAGDQTEQPPAEPAAEAPVAAAPAAPPATQPAASKQPAVAGMDAVVAAYLHQAELLAADLHDAEKTATLEETLGDVEGGPEWHTQMVKAAAALAAAEDISAARLAFGALSLPMIAYVESHESAHTMHKVHCPMAPEGIEGTWLQGGADVQNPWYGANMLACGEVKW